MKTFLKVLLIMVLAVLALKLLPLAFAFGCMVAGLLLALLGLGTTFLAMALPIVIGLTLVLAPIWLPLLALVGLIALIKSSGRSPANA